mgnify:CR=1 FL=1
MYRILLNTGRPLFAVMSIFNVPSIKRSCSLCCMSGCLVTRASLGQPLLKGMPVLVPPKAEQEEIVKYLNEKCSIIDEVIQKKEEMIQEISEYKKSLIYEYVTGKKEVPES